MSQSHSLRREPPQDWQQLRPVVHDPAQLPSALIRPVRVFGVSPKECAEETGTNGRTPEVTKKGAPAWRDW